MLTVPTALWPYLSSQGWRPVEVYEIEAFAGRSILRYSSQDLTWGGNAYTGLAVRRGEIKHSMEFRVPDVDVTFANASNILRPYLTPTDTLTGARMTIRLLARDSGGSLLTDSLVLFRGLIEPPSQVTEDEFSLTIIGLLDGQGVDCPSRRFSLTCPWPFANARAFDGNGHCSYQSTTTTNGSGSSSTALTLTAASTFKNGDRIQIAGGTEVTIVSGGGTVNLTISAARTWSNGATVRYADCPGRTRSECEARGMLFRFGGHPAVASTARLVQLQSGIPSGQHAPPPTRSRGSASGGRDLSGNGVTVRESSLGSYADTQSPVPVLYGRRRVRPKIAEMVNVVNPNGTKLQNCAFAVISNGEISAVKRWYLAERDGVENYAIAGDKQRGTYQRNGTTGTNDTETAAEYVADQTTIVRAQNVDYRALSLVAYSEEAYAILVQDADRATDPTTFQVDAEGIKVQRYNADGSLNGARAYDVSPIWQAADWASSDVFGLKLTASDIDMAVCKPEADYAATLISGTEASTTVTVAQGSATTVCKVKSTEGFVLGRRVDVNGVSNTVVGIPYADEIWLGTAVTQSVGHTVVQRPQRFESHVYIAAIAKGTRWLKSILDSCRGYVTYDAGKVQFRIERGTVAELFPDGGLETWASSTNLTAGVEDLGGGVATINRDGTDKHGGSYSLRIDRSNSVGEAGETWNLTGLEPGRWYRLTFWHKQDATGIGAACRLRVRNTTKSLDCKFDGYTWGVGVTDVISQEGSTSWTQYEATFKVREDFAITDNIAIGAVPLFTAGHSVWYDDFSLRGPYAGDFRETSTQLLHGMKEGSFVWSLDRKDRETNRVAVKFFNESGFFGDDEAVANDFVHQETHPIKSIDLDGTCICDRDQASRIATWALAKRRTLATGCEFTGTPAALAIQPGDVILVSHTIPGWTCDEQRVTDVSVIGLGEADEFFVKVRTEDYLESIYSDTGPLQTIFPPQTRPTVSATVTRNAGGVLDLSITLSDQTVSVIKYEIYLSDTSGFTPDAVTKIGSTPASTFRWQARVDDLDVVRYIVVNAVTDRGTFTSAELTTTIFRADSVASGYSGNYQYPTTIQSVDPTAGFTAYVNESGGAATVAKINDASDSTYLKGSSSATAGTSNNDDGSIRYHSFGAGTHTGRPYIRGKRVATGSGVSANLETVKYYYTLDRTAGSITWVLWQTVTSATIQDYFGPEITADYTKLAFRCIVESPTSGGSTRSCDDYNYRVAFDQKA